MLKEKLFLIIMIFLSHTSYHIVIEYNYKLKRQVTRGLI